MAQQRLSALLVVHNEESRLPSCLERLRFADEIVVVLDRCTDRSKEIAARFKAVCLEGAWPVEGGRRNAGLEACTGDWILEVDADEHVTPALADEIRDQIDIALYDWCDIPIDNYVGARCVRYGWGGSFGTSAAPRLSRKGVKRWGLQRVHPSVSLQGVRGPRRTHVMDHFVDRDISDMLRRLNAYTSAKAQDLRQSGQIGTLPGNLRRLFSRFLKCYFARKGYKEGGMGLLIALCAGLYPLLSHLKARYDD